MANTKATQHEIDLTSSLNLNKFKADIKPYEGFNERNSPLYGGCLSPLYIKDNGTTGYSKMYNGNLYSLSDNVFYKDGVPVKTFSNGTFSKNNIPARINGTSIQEYFDENCYVGYRGSDIFCKYGDSSYSITGETYVQSRLAYKQNKYYAFIETTSALYLIREDLDVYVIRGDAKTGIEVASTNRFDISEDGNVVTVNVAAFEVDTENNVWKPVETDLGLYRRVATGSYSEYINYYIKQHGGKLVETINFPDTYRNYMVIDRYGEKNGIEMGMYFLDNGTFPSGSEPAVTNYYNYMFDIETGEPLEAYRDSLKKLDDLPSQTIEYPYYNYHSSHPNHYYTVIFVGREGADVKDNTGAGGGRYVTCYSVFCYFTVKCTTGGSLYSNYLEITKTIAGHRQNSDFAGHFRTSSYPSFVAPIEWVTYAKAVPEPDPYFEAHMLVTSNGDATTTSNTYYAATMLKTMKHGKCIFPLTPDAFTSNGGKVFSFYYNYPNEQAPGEGTERRGDFYEYRNDGTISSIAYGNTLFSNINSFEAPVASISSFYPMLVSRWSNGQIARYSYGNAKIYGKDHITDGDYDYTTTGVYTVDLIGTNLKTPAGGMLYEDPQTHFRVLADNTGWVHGISYSDDSDCIGTLLTPFGQIDSNHGVYIKQGQGQDSGIDTITYYDTDSGTWVCITHYKNRPVTQFTIIGSYCVFNTDDAINCINLDTMEEDHWASDWNNRAFVINGDEVAYEYNSGSVSGTTSVNVGSAQNVTYAKKTPSSSVLGSIIAQVKTGSLETTIAESDNATIAVAYKSLPIDKNNLVEVYADWKYFKSIDYNGDLITDSELLDRAYLTNVLYNIPLLFEVVDTPYNLTIVSFNNVNFSVYYTDNKIRYQFSGDSIVDFDEIFVVQGQSYGIINDRIYSVTYSNNTIQAFQPIVPINELEYIGYTINNAYFFSPISKAIYSFGADNRLVLFSQADTFAEITGASYIPSTGSILIGTNSVYGDDTTGCLYVLNEQFGLYRVNSIKGFVSASAVSDGSVGITTKDGSFIQIAYEDLDGEESAYVKQPVILDTSFYGAGSNVVSVNDCWYVRVTDPDHGTGEIKLAVSTLTDVGRQTETKTVKVKASDWDELTDTVYIRFQPKLQRAVGVSLHIESPFKVGYIGVGATPETLQLNRGTI